MVTVHAPPLYDNEAVDDYGTTNAVGAAVRQQQEQQLAPNSSSERGEQVIVVKSRDWQYLRPRTFLSPSSSSSSSPSAAAVATTTVTSSSPSSLAVVTAITAASSSNGKGLLGSSKSSSQHPAPLSHCLGALPGLRWLSPFDTRVLFQCLLERLHTYEGVTCLGRRTAPPPDRLRAFQLRGAPNGEAAWMNDPRLNPRLRIQGTTAAVSAESSTTDDFAGPLHPAAMPEAPDGQVIWRTSLSLVVERSRMIRSKRLVAPDEGEAKGKDEDEEVTIEEVRELKWGGR